jgi:hypothetical protein
MKARYIWLPLVVVVSSLAGTLVPMAGKETKPP